MTSAPATGLPEAASFTTPTMVPVDCAAADPAKRSIATGATHRRRSNFFLMTSSLGEMREAEARRWSQLETMNPFEAALKRSRNSVLRDGRSVRFLRNHCGNVNDGEFVSRGVILPGITDWPIPRPDFADIDDPSPARRAPPSNGSRGRGPGDSCSRSIQATQVSFDKRSGGREK